MTSETISHGAHRSLADYAWKVLGPREFVINVLINVPIAYWVYRHAERVPLVGWLSLLVSHCLKLAGSHHHCAASS